MRRMATCHTDRFSEAKGLCMSCYQKDRLERGLDSRQAMNTRNRKYNSTDSAKLVKKNTHYKMRYGVTLQDVEKIRDNQNNKCAICFCDFSIRRSNVDHNHKTGLVLDFTPLLTLTRRIGSYGI